MRHIKTALPAVLGFSLLTAISGCTLTESANSQTESDSPSSPGGQPLPNPGAEDERETAGRSNLFVLNQPLFVGHPSCDLNGQNFGGIAFALIFELVENRVFEPEFGEFILNDGDDDGFGDDVACTENPLPLAPFVVASQDRTEYQPGDVAVLSFSPNVDDAEIRWRNLTTGETLPQFANQTSINFPIPGDAKADPERIEIEAQLLVDGQAPDESQFQDPENTRAIFELLVRKTGAAPTQAFYFPDDTAIALPEEVKVAPPENQPRGNFQGGIFSADPPPEDDGSPTGTEDDLAGYMGVVASRLGVELPDGTVTEAKTAAEVSQAQSTQIANVDDLETTNLGTVSPAADVVLTKLGIDIGDPGASKSGHRRTARQLRDELLKLIGASTFGAPVELRDTPRKPTEVLDEQYVAYLGIRLLPNGRFFNSVVVVRSSLDSRLGPLAELLRDVRQLKPRAEFADTVEGRSALVAEEADKADFLFAIDNSGSMGDEQQTLQAAADTFVQALQLSGLDFRVGVVTTDSSMLQGGGYFSPMAPTQVLRDILVPGIFGAPTESGIFFAEQSLFDSRFGDDEDGSSTTNITDSGLVTGAAGGDEIGEMPASEPIPRRANDPSLDLLGSMSVIMVSDELDQYPRFSGGQAFDPVNNLFTERDYVVHTIIDQAAETRDEAGGQNLSQYRELSQQTRGLTAEIGDQVAFQSLLVDIVQIAGGLSSRLVLRPEGLSDEEFERLEILPASLIVRIDGVPVARSRVNGYEFNVAANRLVFFGDAVPEVGQTIEAVYLFRLLPES